MKLFGRLLLFLVSLFLLAGVWGRTSKKKTSSAATKTKPQNKGPKLNVDILPPLKDVLDELHLKEYVNDFIRMGVTETRLLLKLSSMDFQLMEMEWTDFNPDKLKVLKEKIKVLLEMATVHEDPVDPELELRRGLHYGRIYLNHGVTSYDFHTASFGGFPEMGWRDLDLAPNLYACDPAPAETSNEVSQPVHNFQRRVVLVYRGNCPFVEKALNMLRQNASAMIIINTEDKVESPSSGLGIFNNITEKSLIPLKEFAVISVSNTSGEALVRSVQFHQHINSSNYPKMAMVPVKCHTGGKCLPVTKEELNYNHEIVWGTVQIEDKNTQRSQSFEFLTSNYGGDLPVGFEFNLEYADPIDLCQIPDLVTETDAAGSISAAPVFPKVLIAHRGNCRFDIKSLNAQRLGARVLIVIDLLDQPLQRLGGSYPEVGYIGIPSVLVTAEVAQFLESLAFTSSASNNARLSVQFFSKLGTDGFDRWLEIASTEWSEDNTDRLFQLQGLRQKFQETESRDIVSWLDRRIHEIEVSRNEL